MVLLAQPNVRCHQIARGYQPNLAGQLDDLQERLSDRVVLRSQDAVRMTVGGGVEDHRPAVLDPLGVDVDCNAAEAGEVEAPVGST